MTDIIKYELSKHSESPTNTTGEQNTFTKFYYKHRVPVLVIANLLGYGLGATLMGHYDSYRYSKDLIKIKDKYTAEQTIVSQKYNLYNQLGKEMYVLKFATIHVINNIQSGKSFNKSLCTKLVSQYDIWKINDTFHTDGHDLSYYFGNKALSAGVKLTNWYNANIRSCFYFVKSPKIKLESKIQSFQSAMRDLLNSAKVFPGLPCP